MSIFFKLILLYGLCSVGTSTYFNWTDFSSIMGEEETIADYSGLRLELLSENGDDIRYVCGEFIFKDSFNKSNPSYYDYDIEYYIENQRINPIMILQTMDVAEYGVCEFFDGFFKKNMLPMTHNHNDFQTNGGSVCPIEARTYNIYKADSLSVLDSPSNLAEGHHTIKVFFLKNYKNVGGFEGHFYSINQKLD